MTAVALGETPRLDLGRVVSRSFAAIRRRWLVLGAFMAAYFAIEWAVGSSVRPDYQAGRHDPRLALSIALYLGFLCLAWLRDTALTAASLQPASARFRPSVIDAARRTARAIPVVIPFFVLAALPDIGQTLWNRWFAYRPPNLALALIAPLLRMAYAFAVWGGWGIVLAVAIAEEEGLAASFGRAWRLLSGSRWRFVALFIVISILGMLPRTIAALLLVPTFGVVGLLGGDRAHLQAMVAIAGMLSALVTATWCVMIAVSYLELRRAREGVGADELTQVFA